MAVLTTLTERSLSGEAGNQNRNGSGFVLEVFVLGARTFGEVDLQRNKYFIWNSG